jgi:maltooligosyltrehalose synthase
VVAFQRSLPDRRLVCVVPRFSARQTRMEQPWALGDAWGEARLVLPDPGTYRNAFTGERLDGPELRISEVLGRFRLLG